jgi:hypothetical protein
MKKQTKKPMTKKELVSLIAEPNPTWTRQRPEAAEFKCGWCAHYQPDEPQTEGDEVCELGKCCAKPPTLFAVRGNVAEHFINRAQFMLRGLDVTDISVSERERPREPERHLFAVPVRPVVWRDDTACRYFKSCFRKEFKQSNESEVTK